MHEYFDTSGNRGIVPNIISLSSTNMYVYIYNLASFVIHLMATDTGICYARQSLSDVVPNVILQVYDWAMRVHPEYTV